jgi:hypothetical protein
MVKFITDPDIYEKAMQRVINFQKPTNEELFKRLYKTCVTGGINGKWSTCEQVGFQIVKKLQVEKKHDIHSMEPPYSIGQLQMLRSCNSSSEIGAYIWFTGSFVQSVNGASTWGQRKNHDRVSKA